ncbi:hemoglobin subunit beta-2-like [Mercenaria mercenaria]|uniref:hemoglobin subunit beta-2-like n=1 Tax=Mercenaria mercenaria TaxID=6596 RepID=UPI00234EB967|nr:hemoglobin subunit beta-2-like [Mercenaria mercenaria]
MGCKHSTSYTKHSCRQLSKQKDSVKSRVTFTMKYPKELTPAERQTLRRTWPTLANDLQGNGLQLFLRIFDMCPEVKVLFSVENVRPSQLARNVNIKAHGARFANAIGSVVESLDEYNQKDNKSCKFLFALGQKHKRFTGFKPEYFDIFYEALMCQWKRCMGDQFTPEVSEAWGHLFVHIMETLKEGYFSKEVTFEAQFGNEKGYQ